MLLLLIIHELTAAAEESASRLGAASDVAVKNAEHAVSSTNASLNSTKAKIAEIGILANVNVEQYKISRQLCDF